MTEGRETMETLGLGFCWNDVAVGYRFRTIGRTITEADIVNFIGCTGMVEVLFTDLENGAAHAPDYGRVAPAALVYAIAEGLLVQATMQQTGLAFLNMELDVKGPTRAGDTVHAECEVVECLPTSNNRGLVRTRNDIVNQNGETVITYTPLRLMAGREA